MASTTTSNCQHDGNGGWPLSKRFSRMVIPHAVDIALTMLAAY
uniref:Uncharacterized protein n=1 Tax=Yersinia ruckeri TaxID=29486 RepID=A0A0A8VET0_YERRU|nr:hypothetical protein CSF007_11765 [Yersinia ruckeri]